MSLSLSNGAESDGRQGSARQLEYFVTTVGAARLRRSKWSGAPRACVVCPSLVQRRRCSTAAGRRRAPFPNHVPGAASVWADLSTATTSEVGGFQSLPISCGACMGPPPTHGDERPCRGVRHPRGRGTPPRGSRDSGRASPRLAPPAAVFLFKISDKRL